MKNFVSCAGILLTIGGIFGTQTQALAQLNDTGQIACANDLTVQLACNDETDGTHLFAGQDAEQGRDASDADPDDGLGGFSFAKLDDSGLALADQLADYANDPWPCVQDNVTGLVWEVKTIDGGLQDKDWTYSWYNSTGINDGGSPGLANSGTCFDSSNCDTEKYIAALNTNALCGYSDWRLPDPMELLSIVVLNPEPFASQTFPLPPTIDTLYFPNTRRSDYWTSYSVPTISSAHVIFFGGNTSTEPKSFEQALRLVRGQWGQIQ